MPLGVSWCPQSIIQFLGCRLDKSLGQVNSTFSNKHAAKSLQVSRLCWIEPNASGEWCWALVLMAVICDNRKNKVEEQSNKSRNFVEDGCNDHGGPKTWVWCRLMRFVNKMAALFPDCFPNFLLLGQSLWKPLWQLLPSLALWTRLSANTVS